MEADIGSGYVASIGSCVGNKDSVRITIELYSTAVRNESGRTDCTVVAVYPRVTLYAETAEDALAWICIAYAALCDNPVLLCACRDNADILSCKRIEKALGNRETDVFSFKGLTVSDSLSEGSELLAFCLDEDRETGTVLGNIYGLDNLACRVLYIDGTLACVHIRGRGHLGGVLLVDNSLCPLY